MFYGNVSKHMVRSDSFNNLVCSKAHLKKKLRLSSLEKEQIFLEDVQ
jgi:hypothetical protein